MKKQNSLLLSKIARKLRKRQQRKQYRQRTQAACHFQPLEPRKLLSADGLMTMAMTAPRTIDSDVVQIQERYREVDSTWFEDLAPQVTANVDTGVSSLNWKGTDITTITDQWIIQLNDKALGEVRSVGDTFDLLNLGDYDGQVVRGLGMAGLVLIQTQAQTDANTFMDTIYDSGWVDYIQPNAVLENQATTPNDTNFLNTWGLNNTGQFTGSVADADIDAPEAWDLSTGSSSIVVGVIDTGVKWDHVDLVNNMWTNPGEINGNGIDDDGNGFVDDYYGYDFVNNDGNPMDDHGHGTHVAGTIAADGNNGKGVAGVSWNSQIMGLKFMSSSGSGSTSDAVRAINYATMMKQSYGVNILVTCNSWGGGGYSTSLYNAIVANKNAGMLFMAAAGNDSTNNDSLPHYPSNYNVENVISVASTDWADNLSSFSNYGASSVDIAAPGSNIYSTTYNGGYGYMSGTSMATPQVAGLAALAWSYDQTATWQQIKAAILDNGDTLASLSGKVATGKRINAYNTLNALTESNDPNLEVLYGASPISSNETIDFGTGATDWGSMMDYMDIQFYMTNTIADSTLVVTSVTVDGGFEIVQDATDKVLEQYEDSWFTVRLPTDTAGTYNGTVTITTNDPDTPAFTFKVTGVVEQVDTPAFGVLYNPDGGEHLATMYSVGAHNINDSADYTFRLANTGSLPLTVNSIDWDTVKFPGGWTMIEGLDTTIAGGSSDTFTVRMDTSTSGTKNSYFVINTSHQPIYVELYGSVNEPGTPEVAVSDPIGNDITDGSNTAVNLGSKSQGTNFQKTFTITNTGNDVLTLSNLTVTGDFTTNTNLPASLAAGASTTFTVKTDTTTSGAKSGSVSFNSNDSDEATFNFLLEATVTDAPLPQEVQVTYSGGEITDGQGTAIDFGDLNYGDNAPEITFTVSNTGDKKLTTSGLNVGSGFTIVEGLDSTINAGESDTFTVRMITNAAGQKDATVTFYSNDEDEATFNFDVTGSVEAPADGIDLSVAFADDVDDYITPGKKSKVLVDVTNNGTIAMSDSVTINIYGNTSNTMDGDQILLGTVTKTLNLKPDQSKTNRIVVELDSSIPADDYYLFAVVDPDDTISEGNEDNNTAVTSSTTEFAWKFGDLGDGKKTTLKLEDADGSLVQFSLTGKGVGEVVENNDGSWSVFITGTTSSSKVSIRGKGGDGRVEFQDLIIGDPDDVNDNTVLGQLAGKNVDINGGDFIVTGTIQKLVLGDITDTTMSFNDAYARGTDVTLSQLSDVTINAQTGFNRFTVMDWTDNDSTADAFNAFWVNKLTAKGSSKLGIDGDFETDMTLTGQGAKSNTIDTMVVKGAMNGRTIDVTGNIKLMKVDSVENTDIAVGGSVAKLILGHMLNGSLSAESIDRLTTTIAKNASGSTGDFTADLDISGDKSAKYSLNLASIKGDLRDADWTIAGNVATIVAKGDTSNYSLSIVDEDDMKLNADLGKLVLKDVTTTDVTVEGNIDLVKAANWTGGSITADAIAVVKIDGVMTGDINLQGTAGRGQTLKTMTVKGDVNNVDWDMVGEIGKLQVNGTTTGLDLDILDGNNVGQDASVEKLVFSDVASGNVTVEGEIEFVKADSWSSGSITAEDIVKASLPE